MTKNLIFCFFCGAALSSVLGKIFIVVLKRNKVGQPVYEYVETHKDKNGTPTMGGLFFILSSILSFLSFSKGSFRLSVVSFIIGLAFMSVGFLDDFIKIRSKNNQGLKAYQKIIFQISIAFIAGVFCYYNGLTVFFVPFSDKSVNLGVFTVFFVAFIFIAITNGVNLTDGLDGLAGGVGRTYLFFLVVIMSLQTELRQRTVISEEEAANLINLSASLIGAITGFLLFNSNRASVFMGDTGSLSLGGFIGAISILSGNSFFIPVLGIMFVVSCISVIMQVLYYKKTHKRIFLMAPFHHHLQMKGLTEAKIAYIYSFVTVLTGCLCVLGFF